MGRGRVTEACVPEEHEPMPGWAGASHWACMPCPCHGHHQELVLLPQQPLEQGDPTGGGTHWAEQGSDTVSPSQLG